MASNAFSTSDPVPYVPSPDMPGDQYFEKTIMDNSPLGMKFSRVEITAIVPGSWAGNNGIEVDDEIVSVGSKAFRPLSPQERIQTFKQPRPLTIKFKRPEIKDTYYNLILNEIKVGMGFTGSRVTSISSGGWAERAGVALHDEIVEMAGNSFHDLSDREKIESLKQPRPILLKFKRPGRVLRAEFVNNKNDKYKLLSAVPGFKSDQEAQAELMKMKQMKAAQKAQQSGSGGHNMSPGMKQMIDGQPPSMTAKRTDNSSGGGWFSKCCAPSTVENDVVVSQNIK